MTGVVFRPTDVELATESRRRRNRSTPRSPRSWLRSDLSGRNLIPALVGRPVARLDDVIAVDAHKPPAAGRATETAPPPPARRPSACRRVLCGMTEIRTLRDCIGALQAGQQQSARRGEPDNVRFEFDDANRIIATLEAAVPSSGEIGRLRAVIQGSPVGGKVTLTQTQADEIIAALEAAENSA